VTRSGGRRGSGDAIAELFATSAPEAVLRVLRESGRALAKSEIIDQLAAVGVPRARADKAWSQAQKRLRQDSRVIAEKDRQIVRYRWNPQSPPAPTPADALNLLVEGRLTRGEREALAETVRAALAAGPPAAPAPAASSATPPTGEPAAAPPSPGPSSTAPPSTAPPSTAPPSTGPSKATPATAAPSTPGPAADDMVPASRLRQVELDAARELAGMAIDVEEQVAKGASGKAIIHRVRARMKRLRLEPVGRAGEEVTFDRTQHQPMRAGVPDGARVLVVRPGYIWRLPGEDLVIEKPVVQD
jgi:hypothetical protein